MSSPRSLNTRTEFLPLSLACALWKHRLLGIGTAIALSAVAAVAIRRLPSIYRAEAVVLVNTQSIPERFVAPTVTTAVDDRLNKITREIKSGDRLRELIRDFDVYHKLNEQSPDAAVAKIRADMDITFDRGWTNARTGGFRVAYKGSDPKVVAAVANRLANIFIEENSRVREGEAQGTSRFIDKQLQEAKDRLDQLESRVSQYKVRHNGELPQQENELNGALTRLQLSLQGDQDAIGRAEQNKAMLLQSLKAAELEQDILERAAVKPKAAGIRMPIPGVAAPDPPKRSESLKAQLQLLLQRYSEDHPDVKRARAELARALEQERLEGDAAARAPASAASSPAEPEVSENVPETAITSVESVRARERTAQLKLQIAELDREIQTRGADRSNILSQINAYQGRIESLPIREQELSGLTRDLEIAKNVYTSLVSKKDSAEMGEDMERASQAEKFTLFEAAKVPTAPFAPNRRLYMAVACGASLIFGIVLAIGKELKNNVLLGEWELPKGTPILSRVPEIPALPDKEERAVRKLRRVAS